MTKLELEETIIEVYILFYKMIRKNPNYKFNYESKHNRKTVHKFIEAMEEIYSMASIDEEFIISFMAYTFGQNSGREFYGNKNVILLNWALRKEILIEYSQTDRKKIWKNRKRLIRAVPELEHIKTKKTLAEESKNLKKITTGIHQFEEDEKGRYFNTMKGYGWCSIETTLYNHSSEYCGDCKFADKCKSRLQVNYPGLYKKRGYE